MRMQKKKKAREDNRVKRQERERERERERENVCVQRVCARGAQRAPQSVTPRTPPFFSRIAFNN